MKNHLQCGYEFECEKKDCLNCPKKKTYKISLTHAEETAIEDFGICNLKSMLKTHTKETELAQEVLWKLIHKIWGKEQK